LHSECVVVDDDDDDVVVVVVVDDVVSKVSVAQFRVISWMLV
jgi:hypothetical protein